MKKYSVKEVAELLDTNPETVRRWIRNGKLKASQDSRKEGNVISEGEIQAFLKKNEKYTTIAVSSIAVGMIEGPVGFIGSLLGGVIAEKIMEETQITKSKIEPKEIARLLQKEVKKRENEIKKKEKSIQELKTSIEEDKKQILALDATRSKILDYIDNKNEKESQNE